MLIGHLNVIFFAVKIQYNDKILFNDKILHNDIILYNDKIQTIIPGNVDIIIFAETKLDSSYPTAQLMIEGFNKPFRLDIKANEGGLLIYVRTDIPCQRVNNHEFPDNIEGMAFIWDLPPTHPVKMTILIILGVILIFAHKSMIKVCQLEILIQKRQKSFLETFCNCMT